MMNFSALIAKAATSQLEDVDLFMNQMSNQDILITYQACILVLEHELCIGKKIESSNDFQEFINEYTNSFVLKDEPKEVANIFSLNHLIRKPILQALAQRTIDIFLGAK